MLQSGTRCVYRSPLMCITFGKLDGAADSGEQKLALKRVTLVRV